MSQPTPNPDDRTQYGGQAVVEGVMMRSPRFFAVACRRLSNSEIVVHCEPVHHTMAKLQWLNKPFLRGTLALVDAFLMGYRALTYAANIAAADTGSAPLPGAAPPPVAPIAQLSAGDQGAKDAAVRSAAAQPISNITIGITTLFALAFGFLLFWAMPHALATAALLHQHTHLQLKVALAEGAIRVAVFLGYLLLIARLRNIQRVFEYHGAEHKAINTLETGLPLTIANVREASRIHPRCGTNFIFLVLITAMVVFGFVPQHPFANAGLDFLTEHVARLLLMPVVAGIAFEILKWAGRHREQRAVRALIAPGLWLQYITTRIPDDSQLEVAIRSLTAVWDREHGAETTASARGPADEPASAVV